MFTNENHFLINQMHDISESGKGETTSVPAIISTTHNVSQANRWWACGNAGVLAYVAC